MRKFLLVSIAIIMICMMSLTVFVGCKQNIEKVTVDDFDIIEMNIGKTMPSASVAQPIDSGMSAYEMFSKAVANYYNADFVISQQYGTALSNTGLVTTSQVVDVAKIRVGKGDASGDNSNGATYYADSVSYSSMTSIYEKTIIKGDDIFYRNADAKYVRRDNTIQIKSWHDVETNFKDVPDYVDKKANNPTLIWMYDTSEENVVEASQPLYDEETDTYRFAIIFDPVDSTVEYVKTMRQQLEANAGLKVDKIDFLQLRIRFVLWSNGMIRNMYITESYGMKIAGVLNSTVTLNAEVQFSYDPNESGYGISAFEEAFYDSGALYVKPYGESAVEKLSSIIAMGN